MEPDSSSEHLEKQNKEFSHWIDDLCRTCFHKRLFHLGSSYSVSSKGYVHGNCNKVVELGGFCGCQEWQSPDNLEYIELLAKRKGLIPDDKDEK